MSKLIYASSKDPDFYYALKKNISDPVFLLDLKGKKFVFLDEREYGIFKDGKNPDIEPVLLSSLFEKIKLITDEVSFREKLAYHIFQEYDLLDSEVNIPMNFPIDVLDYLRLRGARLKPVAILCPERRKKSKDEIKMIAKNQKNVLKSFREAEKILAASEIKDGRVFYKGKILTSETIKKSIRKVLIKNDLIDIEGMIVSSGAHSAIPHHSGEGEIRPGDPIIIDIFPKNLDNYYAADMTRTYVKGEPKDEFKKMYEAVLAAQEKAISLVKPGMKTKEIYEAAKEELVVRGFHAGEKGFTHGLGHGLGLDIHEAPSLKSVSEDVLVIGDIITIEPGLYYPEIGGVRIEDVLVVTKKGYKNLTNYPKSYLIG